MLLKIKAAGPNADALGYLVHKHPGKLQSFKLSFGKAHVFYPKATATSIEMVLLLDIDTIGLTRDRNHNFSNSFKLGDYVNDRAYVASSFLSTAISKVLGSALNGTCKDKPEFVQHPFDFEVTVAAVRCTAGEELIKKFFEPLGYAVSLSNQWLDTSYQEWGKSPYYVVKLKHKLPLQQVLQHLFVLLPALDNNKHYYVGEFEVDKLLSKAGEWLKEHPHYPSIVRRYLKHKKSYTRKAIERLKEGLKKEGEEPSLIVKSSAEEAPSVHENRLNYVFQTLKGTGASSVLDLGCGSGKLLNLLKKEPQFKKIVGMDISIRALEIAKSRLYLTNSSPKMQERLQLIHGALTYKDSRLEGFDAAALVEVIEHLDTSRLEVFMKVIFQHAKPNTLIVTTPNKEYNQLFENFNSYNGFRHPDHRFEWTREEFQLWANTTSDRYGYSVRFEQIAPVDEQLGGLSQMAIFTKQ